MKKWIVMMLVLFAMVSTAQAAEKEDVARLYQNGKQVGSYQTLSEAVEAAQNTDNSHIQLLADTEEAVTVSKTVYMDLNGHNVSGIRIDGKLFCVDTATKNYNADGAGSLTPTAGKPEQYVHTQKAHMGYALQYLALENGGSYSFHRFTMHISKLTLNIEERGLGYKAELRGSEALQAALDQTEGCGYRFWMDGGSVVSKTFSARQFSGTEVPMMLKGFLDDTQSAVENTLRGQVSVHASLFLKLADGTVISTEPVSYSYRQMLEKVDERFPQYSQLQQQALKDLNSDFWQSFIGWDIPRLHHDPARWEQVTSAAFLNKLTASGKYWAVPTGNYVLTEDLQLADQQLIIPADKTVNICLNGHNITGNLRLFRNYGTLGICDCAQHDGTVQSRYHAKEGETGIYAPILYAYYGSTFNMYGGNYVSGGKTNGAGSIAISHDSTANAHIRAGEMNMFGGTIHGGYSDVSSGAVGVWNGAVLRMYGGAITGGKSEKNGGCLMVSNSIAYLQGGSISGGEATLGANIYVHNSTVYLTDMTVTGGKANMGGGVYLTDSTAHLAGEVIIADNTGGNLYKLLYSGMSAEGLTGGKIGLTYNTMDVLSDDPNMTSVFFSDTEDYEIRKMYGKTALVAKGVEELSEPAGFSAGFGQSNITPENIEGMPLAGYGNASTRLATAQTLEVYDELLAQTVAITDENGETVLLIACDLIRPNARFTQTVVSAVSAATGVKESNIILSCSHSHSNPEITMTTNSQVYQYNQTLPDLFAQSAFQAMADRQSCTMETGSFEVQAVINGKTKYLNFVRHYQYLDDDAVKYFGDNFGQATYNSSTEHVRDADHTMHLVKFNRNGKDILMANWRIHPHRTGGFEKYKVSADVVGTTRYYAEQKTGMHFIYFNGAAGNINSSSRLSKDNHGLDYVAYGETLADVIVANLECLDTRPSGKIQVDNYSYTALCDHSDDIYYDELTAFKAQYETETVGMTTHEKMAYCQQYGYESYFEVSAKLSRYNRGTTAQLPLNVITVGGVLGLYTAPGELWDTVGVAVEEQSPFTTTFCLSYSMDHNNYFVYYPDSLDQEDGVPYKSYESENRRYEAPKTILDMIDYWTRTLKTLYAQR